MRSDVLRSGADARTKEGTCVKFSKHDEPLNWLASLWPPFTYQPKRVHPVVHEI